MTARSSTTSAVLALQMLRTLCTANPAACAGAATADSVQAILPLLAAGDLDLRLERAAAEALGTLLAGSAQLRAAAKLTDAGSLLVRLYRWFGAGMDLLHRREGQETGRNDAPTHHAVCVSLAPCPYIIPNLILQTSDH